MRCVPRELEGGEEQSERSEEDGDDEGLTLLEKKKKEARTKLAELKLKSGSFRNALSNKLAALSSKDEESEEVTHGVVTLDDGWDTEIGYNEESLLTGACTINRPCAQQYVGKSQSCMVISGRLIVHAPV